MKLHAISLLCLIGLLLSACVSLPATQPAALTVSAAANVQPAFEEIGAAFTAQTGTPVAFNFGATGALAQQIAAGAPADVFAAANTADVEALAARGHIAADTIRPYAIGRLVLYSNTGAEVTRVEDLARPDVKRIAIANPERAPYGVAAREAMQAAGVWDAVQDRLVMGESVGQAFQYAKTGNVDVAFAPLSLTMDETGVAYVVSPSLYGPIVQALGVVSGSPNATAARSFVEFVTGPAGREVLQRYGYDLPEGG